MSLINVVTYKSTMTCKLTIHLPPSRNCSLKYTSALAANANNAAETNGNNVIICILLICGIKPAHSLSPSRARALLLSGFIRVSGEARGCTDVCRSLVHSWRPRPITRDHEVNGSPSHRILYPPLVLFSDQLLLYTMTCGRVIWQDSTDSGSVSRTTGVGLYCENLTRPAKTCTRKTVLK